MMRQLTSLYMPSYPRVLVYMLQASEYQAGPYLKWLWRTGDFGSVTKRRELQTTRPARLLLAALRLGILVQIALGIGLIYLDVAADQPGGAAFGAALILLYPLVWAHLILVPLIIGRWLISRPAERQKVVMASGVFAKHPAVKIAVAGSYGKTTMKELLNTILSQKLIVAATPANKNVSISHAQFARKLKGDENVLIIEYGEGAPGDVRRFAERTHPTHAVITGLAPAHLDKYKTLKAAGEDIFSLADFLKHNNVYVNGESPDAKTYISKSHNVFDRHQALGWRISEIETGLEGTAFAMTKGRRTLQLRSGLIGRHQVGFVAFAAALALELGLTPDQVAAGVAQTMPFEHRMKPYPLAGGWVIDDTYNGNLEGIRAGTELLRELPAKRKIYVTPGLVDQGKETVRVHVEIGKLIADAAPDMVVLMQNSVTKYIDKGLKQGKYKGKIRHESDPLDFYTNLSHFVAAGDLVMMQNDWTDNYA